MLSCINGPRFAVGELACRLSCVVQQKGGHGGNGQDEEDQHRQNAHEHQRSRAGRAPVEARHRLARRVQHEDGGEVSPALLNRSCFNPGNPRHSGEAPEDRGSHGDKTHQHRRIFALCARVVGLRRDCGHAEVMRAPACHDDAILEDGAVIGAVVRLKAVGARSCFAEA